MWYELHHSMCWCPSLNKKKLRGALTFMPVSWLKTQCVQPLHTHAVIPSFIIMTAFLKSQDNPSISCFYHVTATKFLMPMQTLWEDCWRIWRYRLQKPALLQAELNGPLWWEFGIPKAEGSSDRGSLVHRVSEGEQAETGLGPLCNILTKNLVASCWCPENLSEVDFKSDRLSHLAEEVLRQWPGGGAHL